MAQAQASVPLVVLTGREDDVELVNRSLRDGGHPVRCHWVAKIDALAGALDSHAPELLCFFPDSLPAPIREVAKIRQQTARMVPLLVVSRAAEETDIADALLAGAQDLVSHGQTERLRSVAERELRAFRLERALNETLQSASQYKRQLKDFMAGSVDAIAHVQDGIIVDANQAWVELFGHAELDAAVGGPLMDAFDAASQVALKGALVACAKRQWSGEPLKVGALDASGAAIPLKLVIEATTYDGDPAVKLSVPREPGERQPEPEELVEQAVHKDPATGFYHRRRFLEVLTDRLDGKAQGGVRALAFIRPDKFREVEDRVGPISSEDLLVQLAEQLRALAQKTDLYGRFGGQVFTMFLERGNLITCTVGLAEVGPGTDTMETLIAAAKKTNQAGRESGGNRAVLEQTSDASTRVQRFDQVWVQQIKLALMENRFRLAHLPIAGLGGEQKAMLDTVIRMVDAQGDELAAADFMPAAARNRMLRAIDRWVIGATLAFCATQPVDTVFVKLSSESLIDKTLTDWLAKAVDSSGVAHGKLCFQVSEEDAAKFLAQTKTLADQLKKQGHEFAIEHFGIGHDSARVLASTPMHYLKIDGSLMQSLATDAALRQRVRGYIEAANKRGIATIAERVEDANTMAVLFQLGVGYVQGHYLHEPEVVLGENAGPR
jgi:diguanylate cyclase (GGDEF)-like protein